jgi:RNA polymerase sigma-B factor
MSPLMSPTMCGPRRAAQQARHDETERLLELAASETCPQRRIELINDVVVLNREIALGVAHRYHRPGVEMEDLEQVALLGLTKAARRYRPGRGPSFSAYAFPTVAGEVKRYFRDSTWSVRPPRGLQEAVLAVRAAQTELAQQLGCAPTTDQLADVTDMEPGVINKALVAEEGFSALSLDAPVRGADEGTIGETIADPCDDFDHVDTISALRSTLATLTERERLILSLRFDHDMTQEQIGARLGVSQMQVSRTLARVFAVLRERLQDDVPAAEGPRTKAARSIPRGAGARAVPDGSSA